MLGASKVIAGGIAISDLGIGTCLSDLQRTGAAHEEKDLCTIIWYKQSQSTVILSRCGIGIGDSVTIKLHTFRRLRNNTRTKDMPDRLLSQTRSFPTTMTTNAFASFISGLSTSQIALIIV